jgi:hypothetical protein
MYGPEMKRTKILRNSTRLPWGARGGAVVEALCYKPGSIPDGVIGIFH